MFSKESEERPNQRGKVPNHHTAVYGVSHRLQQAQRTPLKSLLPENESLHVCRWYHFLSER